MFAPLPEQSRIAAILDEAVAKDEVIGSWIRPVEAEVRKGVAIPRNPAESQNEAFSRPDAWGAGDEPNCTETIGRKEDRMSTWPLEIRELVFMPRVENWLNDLAEREDWEYRTHTSEHHKPVLFNYVRYTYRRLAEEDKLATADDDSAIAFNTGLVTPSQEPIYCYCTTNHLRDRKEKWHLHAWRRRGHHDLTRFSTLPEMAHYFDDPSLLVLDSRKELRVNVEHIVSENKGRFPEPYRSMADYQLQTLVKGAVDNATERVRRSYKTAVPQYYRGKVQLLLPLCLTQAGVADLALVVENYGDFYRATTCLTLDMAYNNARQLAKPDRDWLEP